MNNESIWRLRSNEVIRRVSRENPGLSELELRKKISDAYPFGDRSRYPYKQWLSAVKMFFEPTRRSYRSAPAVANERQLSLLGEQT